MKPNLYPLKIIANDTRFRIVSLLMKGPLNVGSLEKELQVEQTLLSHHLKKLRLANLVKSERNGKEIIYSLKFSEETPDSIDLGCCKIKMENINENTKTNCSNKDLLPFSTVVSQCMEQTKD